MRILGVDPGYAIVGFGALEYVRGAFALCSTAPSPRRRTRALNSGWKKFMRI